MITKQHTLLSAVTTATTGTALDITRVEDTNVVVSLAANTGAVTITVEASIDGTNYVSLDSRTKTTNTDSYAVYVKGPYSTLRAKTATQSASTVTAIALIRGSADRA